MPGLNNQVQQLRSTLYQLRQDYGTKTDVYRTLFTDTDPESGQRTWVRKRHVVPHGILLPSVLARKFFYDLSYIAANKNFTYGGDVDIKSRTLILDARELPRDFEIATEDMIVIDMTRYLVKDVTSLDYGIGFLVTMTHVVGALPFQELAIRVNHAVDIYQGAANE